MSGTGELVNYTRIYAQTAADKAALITQITAIINNAAGAITVEAMVQVLPQNVVNEIVDELLEKANPEASKK
jgi:hypothetical protein